MPLARIQTDYEDIADPRRGAPGLRLSQTAKSAEPSRKEGEARASMSKPPAINTLSLEEGEEKKAAGPQILLKHVAAAPYEPLDALADTHNREKNLPVASSAELSQGHSELEGIIEPLHRPIDANNKSEIVSELSRIQSESYFNVP